LTHGNGEVRCDGDNIFKVLDPGEIRPLREGDKETLKFRADVFATWENGGVGGIARGVLFGEADSREALPFFTEFCGSWGGASSF
jgi:hypothetical protein